MIGMTFKLEPVFIIFPLFCLLLSIFKTKNTKTCFFIVFISFVVIYAFSQNGSDYISYQRRFQSVESGISAEEARTELGYFYLMKAAVSLGMDYSVFRIILLSLLCCLLFSLLFKLSDNFPLSVFFITSMFVIYTISTYRQFIVMCFSLWGFYYYSRGRKLVSVLGIALLMLFHKSAVLPFAFVSLDWIKENFKTRSFFPVEKNYWFLIIVSIGIRLAMSFILGSGAVNSILKTFNSSYLIEKPSFFSFGFASRCFFLIIISYMYCRIREPDKITSLLYWYYSVSLLLYICIPIELLMGRLMNNANIVCALLIPNLGHKLYAQDINDIGQSEDEGNSFGIVNPNTLFAVLSLVFVAFAVLINQLLHQDGYTPYLNILF